MTETQNMLFFIDLWVNEKKKGPSNEEPFLRRRKYESVCGTLNLSGGEQ